jgi:glycogen phosphorylase
VTASLSDYVANGTTWYEKRYGRASRPLVAYFSMEFGLTESLPIYSGGLGILAGDHLKSASDLGVPLVGVGLLYQKGYFRQYLTSEGWQQERVPGQRLLGPAAPPFHTADGSPVHVTRRPRGSHADVRCWRVQVGRVTLVLLDTNIPRTRPISRTSPTSCTAATATCASARRSCSGSAASGRSLALDLARASST